MSLNEKIGLGSVQFGTRYGIANKAGQTPAEEVAQILDTAHQYGIRTIDTASAYGNAEKVLGYNNLHRFKLISKFMPATAGQTITDQLNCTISDLQINSLYGYLAHSPSDLLENKEQWKELEYLKNTSRIEKIGYSLNKPDELKALIAQNMIPDLVQVPFNYFDNRFKEQLIALKEKGCEIHIRSAFLQGLFFMKPDLLPPFFKEVKETIQNLQLAYENKLPGALLKYVLKFDFVDRVIIGVETEAQLVDNIQKINTAPELPELRYAIPDSVLMPSYWPQ